MSDLGSSSPAPPKDLSEDTVSQECKDLMSSLPSVAAAWHGNPGYEYQGFWYSANSLEGTLNFRRHFKAQDDDIILVTFPKSGTTWLKSLAFAVTRRAQHPSSSPDHPLLTGNPHDLVPFFEFYLYLRDPAPDLTRFPSPRIFATHTPIGSMPESVKRSPCKVVYMCRNPKDAFVSAWHFLNKLRTQYLGKPFICMEDYFEMFCKGVVAHGPFWDHVLGYWKESLENPKKVLFLKYEDVKEQPVECLKKLADFLDCPFTKEEESDGVIDDIAKLCSFNNLSNLDVAKTGSLKIGVRVDMFYRKGDVGDYKRHLTPEMEEKLDKITEEKWHGYNLKF